MLLDTNRDRNIDFLSQKVSVGHILLSDTEFKGEDPAPSGSRPPLVIATTKLTINSTLITLEGRQGTTDHVTFLKLLSIRMVVLLSFHIQK